MANLNKEYIKLTPELYKHCMDHISRPDVSEKTKELYQKELERIFKRNTLDQTLYNKVYLRGSYYRAVLNLLCEVAEFYDLGDYKYKVLKERGRKKIPEPQVWHENQILEMANRVEDYSLLIECAYYIGAGLRFSSAIMLRWDDFQWEDWLQNPEQYGKCRIHAKGDKFKYLVVNPKLMHKLHNIAKNRGKVFKNIPYNQSSEDLFMFVDIDDLKNLEDKYRKENFDNMLDDSGLKYRIREKSRNELIRKKHYIVDYRLRKLAKVMNVKNIKFHSIRHSAATNLLKKGFKLTTIKDQLMHESISTTERYLNLSNIDIEEEFNGKLRS